MFSGSEVGLANRVAMFLSLGLAGYHRVAHLADQSSHWQLSVFD